MFSPYLVFTVVCMNKAWTLLIYHSTPPKRSCTFINPLGVLTCFSFLMAFNSCGGLTLLGPSYSEPLYFVTSALRQSFSFTILLHFILKIATLAFPFALRNSPPILSYRRSTRLSAIAIVEVRYLGFFLCSSGQGQLSGHRMI